MIVGKYFKSNNGFINVMKVCKKYKELVLMYIFNPISDISLFENIQTQHFYNKEDIKNKKDNLYQYIYWYWIDYEEFKNKKDNEIFKNVELNNKEIENEDDYYSDEEPQMEYPLEIENGNCIIPEGMTKIGNKCFYDCSQLTNITLPSTLKEIGDNAFSNTNITTIIIPEGVTKIGNNCFNNCSQLTNITLPSSLKEIGDNAFSNTKITTIIIPEGVTKIGNYCFYDCSQLTNIILPSSLKEIGDNAFSNTKITTITIPESCKYVENGWKKSFPDNCEVIRK